MSENLELKLLRENKELRERLNKLEDLNQNSKIPIFTFSKIKREELESLLDIKENMDNENIFKNWFSMDKLNNEIEVFLLNLLKKHKSLIKHYREEDLKLHFLSQIFNKIEFISYENEIRDFYNEPITYKTDKFIFTGETDFVISKGLKYSKKPYFFIQEFKKGIRGTDPEPQLIAELISAVELNSWKTIKGAYIIGSNWNFVILEKIEKSKYQYFVSDNFDSSKIEDLKSIYKNLLFVKNEIIEMVKNEK